jgi:hypothetical protein
MARYRVMTWRGIPTQVNAQDDTGGRVGRPLQEWFTQEVDRVAMREGLIGSDAYLEAWTWSAYVERPGTARDVAEAVAMELEAEWGRRPTP